MTDNSTFPNFPSHLVSPEEKGRNWIMQYCKAAWSFYDSDLPRNIFWNARFQYQTYRDYAMGNQSINKYKPYLGVDESATDTNLAIDWSVIPIVPKFRRIALGKLKKIDYNIVATPIDSLAADEVDTYFAEAKAKILLREAAEKMDPSLLELPALQLSEGEAKDLEELEIQMNFTFKHQMAIEAEQAIKLVFEQNDMRQLADWVKEDLFDFGVAGYKEWIDSNGAIKIRRVHPRAVICGPCRRNDFKDSEYVGEVIEMTISDLKQAAQGQFSELEYEEIAKNHVGMYGNPGTMPESTSLYNRGYDKFKIRVLDIEFFSVNQTVFESRVDRRGNKIFARAKYEDRNKRKDKFQRISYKVVYKAKWIIGTNYIFDYGLATDMKRAKSSLMDTELSYHLFSPEFWDMKAYGMMEQLIPIADAIQIAWYKLQNAINQSRPKGIMIEIGALEDVPFGAGGKKLTPLDIVDLYNKSGTLIYRKQDTQGRMTNYKPIEELENGLGRDVIQYWDVIQRNIQLLRDITGLNEFTDGSTPDPRSLTTVAKLAAEGTNNALSGIVTGDRRLRESVAKAVMLRLQDVVGRGEVKGYVRSLGGNTMKFIKVHPNIAMHEYGIMIEDKPTDEQRAMLMQQIQAAIGTGLVTVEDAVMIQNTDNLKVAEQVLAYRVKKREKEMEEKALRQQEMNGKIQQESSIVAEQAKQQTLQMEIALKTQLEQIKIQGQKEIMMLKMEYEAMIRGVETQGKVETKKVENEGKRSVARINKGQPDQIETPTPQLPIIEDEMMEDETEQQYTELPGESEEIMVNEDGE